MWLAWFPAQLPLNINDVSLSSLLFIYQEKINIAFNLK